MFDSKPDFDQLMHLAKNDPEGLDSFLSKEVSKLINAAPEHFRHRLRGIQFEVDCHRKTQKSSYDACKKISEMMLSSVRKLNNALNTPYSEPSPKEAPLEKAKVLSLPTAV